MKTILLKSTFLVVTLLITVKSFSQDESPTISVSGSVDAYYRANINGSNNPQDTLTLAPSSSFANLPGFSLGMANLVLGVEGEKSGLVADLVFGPRGADAVFGSPAPLNIVNQLYVYWNITEDLTFTLGNFNTFLGYEVISPTGNFNYSTSYMFSYGPFSHTGMKLDYTFGSGFSFMAAIMNPTDATDFNPSGEYVGGFQLGYSNDAGGAWLNAIVSDGFYQVDLTTGWDLTDAIYLGFNGTTNTDFYGAAIYAQASVSEPLALGVRAEYFADESGVAIAAGESVIDFTFSANYTVGSLTLIAEFRVDALSYDGYATGGDVTDPALEKSLSSFVLGAYYSF